MGGNLGRREGILIRREEREERFFFRGFLCFWGVMKKVFVFILFWLFSELLK